MRDHGSDLMGMRGKAFLGFGGAGVCDVVRGSGCRFEKKYIWGLAERLANAISVDLHVFFEKMIIRGE